MHDHVALFLERDACLEKQLAGLPHVLARASLAAAHEFGGSADRTFVPVIAEGKRNAPAVLQNVDGEVLEVVHGDECLASMRGE